MALTSTDVLLLQKADGQNPLYKIKVDTLSTFVGNGTTLQQVTSAGSTTTTGASFDGDVSIGVSDQILLEADGSITADSTITANLFSGPLPYSDLTGTPTIPTNNNQLTNGAGYITSADGGDANQLDGHPGSYYLDYGNFTNTPTIPTDNNQLTNGAGYITIASVPTNNNQLTNGAGYYKSGDNVSLGSITATSMDCGTY